MEVCYPLLSIGPSDVSIQYGEAKYTNPVTAPVSHPLSVLSSNITFALPALDFRKGNIINICFAGTAVLLWLNQKRYYRARNARNAKRLAEMSDLEIERERLRADELGNRSVLFKFTT